MKLIESKGFWENAINTRRSCRNYEPRPVEDKTMAKLKAFIENITLPFEHDYEIRFFKTQGRSTGNSLRNPPPDGMAFLSKTDPLSVAKTGFMGELPILYATGLGLSTCWYGHYILRELERIMPHLGEHANDPMPSYGYGKGEVDGIRAICMTPLGYQNLPNDRPAFMDRMTSKFMSKRKPAAELMESNQNPELFPQEIQYALDLARKAPSGANSQHWRFAVSDEAKTITIAKPKGYKHIKWEHCDVDVAICACHFWIGLQIQDVACSVEPFVDGDRVVWRIHCD